MSEDRPPDGPMLLLAEEVRAAEALLALGDVEAARVRLHVVTQVLAAEAAAQPPPVEALAVTVDHHRLAVAAAAAFVDGVDRPGGHWELLVNVLNETVGDAEQDPSMWPGVVVALCQLVFDALSGAVAMSGSTDVDEEVSADAVQRMLARLVLLREELM